MSDWTSEPHPDDLLDGLPGEARQELDQIAHEITVRDSMVYLDGKGYDGPTPGLRTEARGRLMVTPTSPTFAGSESSSSTWPGSDYPLRSGLHPVPGYRLMVGA